MRSISTSECLSKCLTGGPVHAPATQTPRSLDSQTEQHAPSSLCSEGGALRAAAHVENPEPTAAHVHQAIRTLARPPDGGRSHSVAKRWLKTREPWRIIAAIEGMRSLVDRGAFEDWTPPIARGAGFSLRAMNGSRTLVDHHSGERIVRDVYELALEASDPPPPRQRKTRTHGEPMKRISEYTERREAS